MKKNQKNSSWLSEVYSMCPDEYFRVFKKVFPNVNVIGKHRVKNLNVEWMIFLPYCRNGGKEYFIFTSESILFCKIYFFLKKTLLFLPFLLFLLIFLFLLLLFLFSDNYSGFTLFWWSLNSGQNRTAILANMEIVAEITHYLNKVVFISRKFLPRLLGFEDCAKFRKTKYSLQFCILSENSLLVSFYFY